jgi:hypothetical protein
MKTEHQKLHDKLDQLYAMMEAEVYIDLEKTRDLILHFLNLMQINRKQLRK